MSVTAIYNRQTAELVINGRNPVNHQFRSRILRECRSEVKMVQLIRQWAVGQSHIREGERLSVQFK